MSLATDQNHLLQRQYRNGSNLNARMALHAQYSLNTQGWHRWVFDQFDFPQAAQVLELGCGPGTLWFKNQERIPAGWHITLSDLSPGMVEEARRNLTDCTTAFHFQTFDAQSIPLSDASLDAVIANHMLYHVPDRSRTFAEISRVLKAGGRLYAATNGIDHLREIDELKQRLGIAAMPSGNFKLENGKDELAAWFEEIRVLHYEDGLKVTEAEPLVAYILSELASQEISIERIQAFRGYVAQQLAQKGFLSITKSSGLFLAGTRRFSVVRCSKPDFDQILQNLSEFWGSERTRALHYHRPS